MTNYNDGQWYGWNGGECPVHPETMVQAVLYDKTYADRPLDLYRNSERHVPAKELIGCWQHRAGLRHVIAFRVVKEHKEPREFWLCDDEVFGSRVMAENWGGGEIIHVKEVLK